MIYSIMDNSYAHVHFNTHKSVSEFMIEWRESNLKVRRVLLGSKEHIKESKLITLRIKVSFFSLYFPLLTLCYNLTTFLLYQMKNRINKIKISNLSSFPNQQENRRNKTKISSQLYPLQIYRRTGAKSPTYCKPQTYRRIIWIWFTNSIYRTKFKT